MQPGQVIDRSTLPQRALLLLTARTYRARPFIEAASRLGIEVVTAVEMHRQLAEYWNHPLGLEYNEPDEAAQAIVQFAAKTPLGAILAVDDSGSLVAAKASAALGLPHNAPEAAEAARDKYAMRRLLAAAGVPSPQSTRYEFEEPPATTGLEAIATQIPYPCVVKPLNLCGSRGVIRADDPAEFVAAAGRLQRLLYADDPTPDPKPFLVEQFVPGFEVALEGILDDGRLQLLALFDKPDPLDGPFFEETIYVTPSRLPAETQAAITACAARAAAALGLREGPMHAELRVNDQGPWIVEVAGRSIGGLCSQTLRFSSDASLEELILRQAFGLEIRSFRREQAAGGVMMIPIPEAGLLKKVEGCEAAAAVHLVEGVEITARLNYSLTPLPEGDSYLGFIFARGESPAAVEAALREAHSKLRFEIAPEIPLTLKQLTLDT
ncbi:MAG: ATP-grasp domain-containing protein [Chloroflexi bacterium]|nr:ATP-grasp domain-containing protein [Chloroflexota bacterium]MCI0580271.1 ATP-grasp domain-containing protein [Chloroflexota bacterium]MCI0643682.1 ATP-grasp domain-containing protein [Chloroflexota bacterium]MCI0729066.1 ATP-grasp domain-containing protein [Chloroflexota bacterium]